MSDIRMQSIFLDEEFVYIQERSSYNRNGNREPARLYKDKEGKIHKEYQDPRDDTSKRGSDNRYRERINGNEARSRAHHGNAAAEVFNRASDRYNKAEKTSIPGSQKRINARRAVDSADKAYHDDKAREKLQKYKEKGRIKESTIMDMIDII